MHEPLQNGKKASKWPTIKKNRAFYAIANFLIPVLDPPQTGILAPSRHPHDNHWTPARHLPDIFQTPFRHPQDSHLSSPM